MAKKKAKQEEPTVTPDIVTEPIPEDVMETLRGIFAHKDIHSCLYAFYKYQRIYSKKNEFSKEQVEELNAILIDRRILHSVQSGMKAFDIDGRQVIALNQKNAYRKISGVRVKREKVAYSNDYSGLPKKPHKHYELPNELLSHRVNV